MENVQIEKTIYGLQSFNNVVDTNFSQLVSNNTSTLPEEDTFNVNDFFDQYNNLFLEIPLSGSDDTHLGLATKSLEYLGMSLEDLQNEISFLRQENTELKNQVLQLSNLDPGELED